MVERSHRDMWEYFRRFETDKDWDRKIVKVLHSMNSSICRSTGFVPEYLFFGGHSNVRLESNNIENENCTLEHKLWKFDLILAREISNNQKSNPNYKFPEVAKGTPVVVKQSGKKNAKMLHGTIAQDNGNNATALVKLDSGVTFKYHKGHIWLIKGTNEYERVFMLDDSRGKC